jgi:hypothetical protein
MADVIPRAKPKILITEKICLRNKFRQCDFEIVLYHRFKFYATLVRFKFDLSFLDNVRLFIIPFTVVANEKSCQLHKKNLLSNTLQ